MYAAATGMAAQQQSLDVIADNLANADVPGFKSAQATFAAIGGNAQLGTASTGVHAVFAQGKLIESGGPFDLAIDGAGFFAVERDGRLGFTRAGSFSRRPDGSLDTPDGWKLRGLNLPRDAQSARVGPDGGVSVTDGGGAARRVGRVRLVTFDAPEKLRPAGSAIFAQTQESGRARPLSAGGQGQPKIAFGMLEKSNVSIVESMMAILSAQRAYEANSKGVQAADEMLRIANNIHRS